MCLIPELERSPGGGRGNLLQYSCLDNLIDRGAWQATVHRVAQSWTQLNLLSMRASSLTTIIIVLMNNTTNNKYITSFLYMQQSS